jgi:hypothetical protein
MEPKRNWVKTGTTAKPATTGISIRVVSKRHQ